MTPSTLQAKLKVISMHRLLVVLLVLISFCNYTDDKRLTNQFISIKNDKFIDAQGRQIILHGINLVNKNKKVNYLGDESAQDFKVMKEWGFNCIRLGIIWDGLEPDPGF